MFRPNKHHPLTERQKRFNDAVGRRRARVEQIFARPKGVYGWDIGHYCRTHDCAKPSLAEEGAQHRSWTQFDSTQA